MKGEDYEDSESECYYIGASQGKFAQVCVEIDLLKPLKAEYQLKLGRKNLKVRIRRTAKALFQLWKIWSPDLKLPVAKRMHRQRR